MEVATVTVPFACGRQLQWADVVPHLKTLKDERARQLTHVLVQEKGAHPRDTPMVRGVASRDSRELVWLETSPLTALATPIPATTAAVRLPRSRRTVAGRARLRAISATT
jgi:hypothetical protein